MPYKFSEEEKRVLREKYLANIATLNSYIAKKEDKIKPDLSAFNKKLDDPKVVYQHKVALEARQMEAKKKEIQSALSKKFEHLKIEGKDYPLPRVLHQSLIASDEPEAMKYNEEMVKSYFLHPEAFTQKRMEALYNVNLKDLAAISKCKDVDGLKLAWATKHAQIVDDGFEAYNILRTYDDKNMLTKEAEEFQKSVGKNYEFLVDTAELPKAYNEFFLTVPPLSDKQMGAIMGNRNFIRDQQDLFKGLQERQMTNLLHEAKNEKFRKLFDATKKAGVNFDKDGPFSNICIDTQKEDPKYVSFNAWSEIGAKTDDPIKKIDGDAFKKLFAKDYAKEENFKLPEMPEKYKEPSWKAAQDDFYFQKAIREDKPIHEFVGKPLAEFAKDIKGGVKERLFNTTSLEYKHVIKTLEDFDNKKHVGYHNSTPVKLAANQYLIHKGVKTREEAMALTGPSKDRALLCFDLIETFQKNESPALDKIVPGTLEIKKGPHERWPAIEDPSIVEEDLVAPEVPNENVKENVVEIQEKEPEIKAGN